MDIAQTHYNWNILTYGMMLAWKSKIGELLAAKLNIEFKDLDDFLVEYLWVKDIWEFISDMTKEKWDSSQAWEEFWKVENKCLKILLWDDTHKLIAAWGRTIMYPPNRQLVRETQWLVRYYLEVDYDEQVRRAKIQTSEQLKNRPALQGLSDPQIDTMFERMQHDRSKIYTDFAEWNIYNTWWKFDFVVRKIYEHIMQPRKI